MIIKGVNTQLFDKNCYMECASKITFFYITWKLFSHININS